MKRVLFALIASLMATFCFAPFTRADAPANQPAATQPDDGAIRIKAGADKPFTDPHGHVWQADTGFEGGDTTSRDADLKIENTDMPDFYRSEHYDMTKWSGSVPNGTYTVKLYFCETYEGITDAGQRIFSVKVGDQEVKDLDIFKQAGGAQKPIIKTFENIPVTDGKLTITFESNVQSPEINGIEIIPKKN
jgi:hypothetical protein